MARWQIVVKTSEATKQTKDQNDNKKQTNKTKQKTTTTKLAEGAGVEKQITNCPIPFTMFLCCHPHFSDFETKENVPRAAHFFPSAPSHVEYTPILCTLRCNKNQAQSSHENHTIPHSSQPMDQTPKFLVSFAIHTPHPHLHPHPHPHPHPPPTHTHFSIKLPASARAFCTRASVCTRGVCVTGGGGDQWMHYFVSFKSACCHYYCF